MDFAQIAERLQRYPSKHLGWSVEGAEIDIARFTYSASSRPGRWLKVSSASSSQAET